MTETDITMTMKFDKNKLFILSLNPEYSTNVSGTMSSNYWGCGRPSNIPHD